MDWMLPARKLKPAGYVARRDGMRYIKNHGYALYDSLRPYRYDASRYELDFLELTNPPMQEAQQAEVPRRIFVVWAGNNPMNENRRASLKHIRDTNGFAEVILVTQENLDEWVIEGRPLHPAYEYLSAVHRSDYSRSYLLHHHGGGYTDLKRHPNSWESGFQMINDDREAWIVGYKIPTVREATVVRGDLGRDVHRHYSSLIGTGGMIARAHSPLTHEWVCEANRRMDYYATLLSLNPGNTWGDNVGYPVPWTTLGSQILEPLCLKYLGQVRHCESVKPQLWGHR